MHVSPRTVCEYERAFAKWFGSGRVFSFWKGRVGLYAILRALGVGAGDEVILPGYTCVMNAAPIKYVGAKPVYVDIEPDTYNINTDLLEAKVTPKTKAVIAQHTYGYPAEVERIMEIGRRHQITIIEDCCLALGSRYKGKLLGMFGKASYFSSQWNKTYTTGLGGMVLCNDAELAKRILSVCEAEAISVPFGRTLQLLIQLFIYYTFVYPRTAAMAGRIFRWLGKRGVVLGSSSMEETQSSGMSEDFFIQMGFVQAKVGLREMKRLQENIEHRRKLAALYDMLLVERGWRARRLGSDTEPVMVRYPVRIVNKWEALEEAAKRGIELGSWFESPLHAKEGDLEEFDYEWGMCPEGERAAREVVNLPVHRRVSEKTARRTVDFVCRFEQLP
jgi:dTDP-4-amino-4,6-dideoxygalactose transaminase